MGADLYINLIYEKQKAKYEPLFNKWVRKRDEAKDEETKKACQEKAVYYFNKMQDSEGYFRDSYNSSNLLHLFELDYWEYFACLLEKGLLKPDKAKHLLDDLKIRERKFYKNLQNRIEEILKKDTTETEESLKKYFIGKYFQFRKFLQTAIDNGYDIECSI